MLVYLYIRYAYAVCVCVVPLGFLMGTGKGRTCGLRIYGVKLCEVHLGTLTHDVRIKRLVRCVGELNLNES